MMLEVQHGRKMMKGRHDDHGNPPLHPYTEEVTARIDQSEKARDKGTAIFFDKYWFDNREDMGLIFFCNKLCDCLPL